MPDDETVNQMIARHEEEFDLFMVSATGTRALRTLRGLVPRLCEPCAVELTHTHTPPPSLLTPNRAKGLSDGGIPSG